MKLAGKILFYPLFLLNILTVLLLLVCAWSGYLFVKSFPILSLSGMAFPIVFAVNILFLLLWLIFRKRTIWLPLAGIFLTLSPLLSYSPLNIRNTEMSEKDTAIRLLSYNVHGFSIGQNLDGGMTNPVLHYLNSSDCDILCLQESNETVLKRNRAYNKDFLPEIRYDCHTVGMSVMSRWPIIEWNAIHFENSKNKALYCRILIDGDTLAVYSCHFQSFGLDKKEIDEYNNLIRHPNETENYINNKSTLKKLMYAAVQRSEQAEQIAGILDKETARYIILCGDFNDTPLSYSHRIISHRLTDAYRAAGFGPGISYHENNLYFRIDHVFCNDGLEPLKCRVDNSIKDSDHYPIHTVFRFRK